MAAQNPDAHDEYNMLTMTVYGVSCTAGMQA